LLARSGATAEFLAGGEVPYSTTDANGNTNTVFKPYGVSLKITPHVERNGAVRSRTEVEVSSVDTAVSLPNGPSLKTRRAATEFNVRSGQTLVLAGFLSRELSVNRDAVPGLSDLPIIGALFGSTRKQRADTELAIFVTPVLADADHPDVVQRVVSSTAVLQTHFPEPPRLNLPIRQQSAVPSLPVPISAPAIEIDTASLQVPGAEPVVTRATPLPLEPGTQWNPRTSPGSQWLAN
jgi:type II secretory pathway component GspD/PulD (secretin)